MYWHRTYRFFGSNFSIFFHIYSTWLLIVMSTIFKQLKFKQSKDRQFIFSEIKLLLVSYFSNINKLVLFLDLTIIFIVLKNKNIFKDTEPPLSEFIVCLKFAIHSGCKRSGSNLFSLMILIILSDLQLTRQLCPCVVTDKVGISIGYIYIQLSVNLQGFS